MKQEFQSGDDQFLLDWKNTLGNHRATTRLDQFLLDVDVMELDNQSTAVHDEQEFLSRLLCNADDSLFPLEKRSLDDDDDDISKLKCSIDDYEEKETERGKEKVRDSVLHKTASASRKEKASTYERKRREKIRNSMRSLAKLVPSSRENDDQTATLDKAIEHIKQLRAHVQVMSTMMTVPTTPQPSMFFPGGNQAMQLQLQLQPQPPLLVPVFYPPSTFPMIVNQFPAPTDPFTYDNGGSLQMYGTSNTSAEASGLK